MIDIKQKSDCTSCHACYNICPKNAIKMTEDNEGFKYPVIDRSLCTKCYLCDKVCHAKTENKRKGQFDRPIVVAAQSRDADIRIASASGGIFSELAKIVLNQSGYICGAIYDENWMVKHILTNDENELENIRSSKYLQSDINLIYKEIEKKIIEKYKVLVCGSPCQIAGLRAYLKNEYENLITCDFICRGMNSPKMFRKYIDSIQGKYKSQITKIKFKNKTYGWRNFSTRIDFENGKRYMGRRYEDSYMIGYLKYNAFMRPSCYDCKFKDLPRYGDLTLADFWGIEKIDKKLADNRGTSLLLINSEKGKKIFELIKKRVIYKEIYSDKVFLENVCMKKSVEMTESRKNVFENIDKLSYEELSNKYFPEPRLIERTIIRVRETKIIQKLKPIIKPIYVKYKKKSR